MLFNEEDTIANFRMDRWSRLDETGVSGNPGEDSISSSREERSVTFQEWLRVDVPRGRLEKLHFVFNN